MTEETRRRTAHGSKLLLDYGPSGSFGAFLEIEEAPASSPIWGPEAVYPAPSGYLDLTSSETSSNGHDQRTQWTGVMQRGGLILQFTSWSRQTVIAAARALRPLA